MKQFRTIWYGLLMMVFVIACSEKDDENDDEGNNGSGNEASVSLEDIAEGEGSYALVGDVELSGTGEATHYYSSAMTSDTTSWSIHEVKFEDVENSVNVSIEFYILDAEADAYSGKEPEPGTYRVYEPGLTTPTENYAKVNVYGDGLASYFSTQEESELELTVDDEGTWESSFENELDDYETDEEVTIYCAFKATAE